MGWLDALRHLVSPAPEDLKGPLSEDERRRHLPPDEASVVGLPVNWRNVALVVRLLRQGTVVRGKVLDVESVSRAGGDRYDIVHYGWLDRDGRLVRRRAVARVSAVRDEGLQNREFPPRAVKGDRFAVAYDEAGRHAVFFQQGSVRVVTPSHVLPPPAPGAPPPRWDPAASSDELLRVAASTADTQALRVIADQLLERGDARGELMQLQLSRDVGIRATPREVALLNELRPRWVPRNAEVRRYAYGLPYTLAWTSHDADLDHPTWHFARRLVVDGDAGMVLAPPNDFYAAKRNLLRSALPNLRELIVACGYPVPKERWLHLGPQLHALRLAIETWRDFEPVLRQVQGLRRLELSSRDGAFATLTNVLRAPLPSLESVCFVQSSGEHLTAELISRIRPLVRQRGLTCCDVQVGMGLSPAMVVLRITADAVTIHTFGNPYEAWLSAVRTAARNVRGTAAPELQEAL